MRKIVNNLDGFKTQSKLRITERDFMTAILNYTSGLIEAKKMDSAMSLIITVSKAILK